MDVKKLAVAQDLESIFGGKGSIAKQKQAQDRADANARRSVGKLDRESAISQALEGIFGGAKPGSDDSRPVGEDPRYKKYFKMLAMHLPRAAVEQKMVAEGVDPAVLDLDPTKPRPVERGSRLKLEDMDVVNKLESLFGGKPPPPRAAGPVGDDPRYKKYFKMLAMHLPRGAVEQKMASEGLDPKILDLDPAKPPPGDGAGPRGTKLKLEDMDVVNKLESLFGGKPKPRSRSEPPPKASPPVGKLEKGAIHGKLEGLFGGARPKPPPPPEGGAAPGKLDKKKFASVTGLFDKPKPPPPQAGKKVGKLDRNKFANVTAALGGAKPPPPRDEPPRASAGKLDKKKFASIGALFGEKPAAAAPEAPRASTGKLDKKKFASIGALFGEKPAAAPPEAPRASTGKLDKKQFASIGALFGEKPAAPEAPRSSSVGKIDKQKFGSVGALFGAKPPSDERASTGKIDAGKVSDFGALFSARAAAPAAPAPAPKRPPGWKPPPPPPTLRRANSEAPRRKPPPPPPRSAKPPSPAEKAKAEKEREKRHYSKLFAQGHADEPRELTAAEKRYARLFGGD